MTSDDLKKRLEDELAAAVGYADSQFAADRIEAVNFYLGKQFNTVPTGRSTVVATEVSDVVEFILPSLMEVFMRSGDIVRFTPRNRDDVGKAQAATILVNSIFTGQNNGFLVLHDFVKDALLLKAGVLKVYYEEQVSYREDTFTDVTSDELSGQVDPEDEILASDVDGVTGDYRSITLKRRMARPKVCVENVPPEDFLFSPQATSVEDAAFLAQRTYMTVGELVALGYDRSVIEEYAGVGEGADEEEKRVRHEQISTGSEMDQDEKGFVRVVEAYLKVDEGDGETLTRILAIGDDNHILEAEPAERAPFVVASPIRVPHRMVGRSVAETLTDIQRIKSGVLRGVLDNMNLTNHGRMAVVENAVNLDDLLTSRPDGIVRMQAPGMVQPLAVPQVMDQGLRALAYLDDVRDTRTGFSKASLGLDPDALQSTTATAVNATIQAGQIKTQMIARVLAETGLRPLARLILDTAIDYFDQPYMARIGDEFEEIDPASIDVELDIEIDVGLGSGRDVEKTMALRELASEQKDIIAQLGLDNPIVRPEQYVETLRRLAMMAGIRDFETFFASAEEMAEARAMAEQQPPEPDPEVAKAQAEIELKREQMLLEMELKREQMQIDRQMRVEELSMEFELRQRELEAGGNPSDNLPRVQ